MSKNDTVNRKQAIDAFYPIRCKLQMMDDTQTADKVMHGLWLAEKAIEQLPSAQSEQRWIPVSERLPEAEVEVFVYLFDRPSPHIAWMSKDGKWHTEDFTLEVDENPAAWMPLPKPYKEEQDEID